MLSSSGLVTSLVLPFRLLREAVVRAIIIIINNIVNWLIMAGISAALAWYMQSRKQQKPEPQRANVFSGVGHFMN